MTWVFLTLPQENGFLLTMDQNNLCIMETDWAENRAKIPQDFIRASLGKLLDSLYSTAERDKFRTVHELLAHELQVLLMGGDPAATRAAPPWRPITPVVAATTQQSH